MDVSVGIISHNDDNLADIIASVYSQDFGDSVLLEVIVISSGMRAGDKKALMDSALKRPNLSIVFERKRCGKAHAVNLLLRRIRGDVCILISGDIKVAGGALGQMLKPLKKPGIGMVGAHPIPLNGKDSFVGFAVNLIWSIHHRLSLIRPKTGELIAFRNVVGSISEKTAVDEAWMESEIAKKGLKIAYVEGARIYNMGPQNLREYVSQRRRIHIGHLHLRHQQGYRVASLVYGDVARAYVGCLLSSPGDLPYAVLVGLLEVCIRLLAGWDYYIRGENPYCWEILPTSKFKRKASQSR